MLLTVLNSICLIALGLAGFLGWEKMGAEGNPAEMLMPVFFGGALLICLAFGRQHYRHGLYGGVIIALLGVISAAVRIYQYEAFQSFDLAKTRLIAGMAGICLMQMAVAWKEVQDDRNDMAPPI
ncbi:hypothetical protein JIN77_08300 [Verrucomicrobiaceae bacterium R5-34]|uniref:Uncharacterized protein n=1 Tax=Oceaniferula flava TaxID=2800421 RepID=A0AAE2SGI4_9BACT|nr:hypothetical protein [Oceaniferula flavus]MBK1830723.1 hypothetical protein [Verrucomicrobiaceae bacterium R5-34]MBK1855981.1 hypothetical protein [Oceaniferula flavus]MBM1137288.1 hypothetical protein [Oceaniferula flavus]